MPHKQLLFRSEAREKVLRGATAIADAVRVTLGPKSRCVLIEKKWGRPLVCNDGVTIAKEFALKDPDENLGAQMLRGAAERTGDAVGDGTTTVHPPRARDRRRRHAQHRRRRQRHRSQARARSRDAVGHRRASSAQSRPVQSEREKQQVATISAHNDPGIGELVARRSKKVGAEGAVTVEEAKGTETTMEVVEGLQFDRGFLSPYFVTDPEKMEAVLEDALGPALRRQDQQRSRTSCRCSSRSPSAGHRCCVIAEDVEGEALATLVVNRLRGASSPTSPSRRRGSATAARRCCRTSRSSRAASSSPRSSASSSRTSRSSSSARASRVIVDREHTTIVGGKGDKAAIAGRCQELRKQIAETTSDYDREKLEERLAKLSGGVAVIRVGAPSEAEMKSRREAFDDAIHATRAAVAEGIVPGAGLALLRAIPAVDAEAARHGGDERAGAQILAPRARGAGPTDRRANSGVDGGVVVEPMRNRDGSTSGSTRPPGSTSTWWRPVSSTRRRSSAWRSRMPCLQPASCC